MPRHSQKEGLIMAEVTSGEVVVIVLDYYEADALKEILRAASEGRAGLSLEGLYECAAAFGIEPEGS